LKENRQIRVSGGSLQAVSQAGLCGADGTIVWLKDYGEIKVFCVRALRGHGRILGNESQGNE
jgi:hypothetical protein